MKHYSLYLVTVMTRRRCMMMWVMCRCVVHVMTSGSPTCMR